MSECRYEAWIDAYLRGKLDEGRQKEFEEHYFNCLGCFDKVIERDEFIGVLKGNPTLFASGEFRAIGTRKPAWSTRIFAFLAPRQWALVGAAATLLIAALMIVPIFRGSSPRFIMTGEETVRGGSLTLVSPVTDSKTVPSEFRWKALGGNLEYQVSIYDGGLLWKTATKESRVLLPEDIKVRMVAGHKYSWQVKAFNREGTLIAVSRRVQFAIAGPK